MAQNETITTTNESKNTKKQKKKHKIALKATLVGHKDARVVRGVRTEPKRYFGHVLERQNGEDLETKCCKAR